MLNNLHFDMKYHYPLTPYTLPLLIWDVIENFWPKKDVKFTQKWPREDVTEPTIVWSVYRKVPGRDGLEINKPRYRGRVPDSENYDVLYEQYSQWMTIIYQFEIYDVSNPSLNELQEEFEDLMFHVTKTLKDFGVSEWLFDEELSNAELGRESSQEIYRRVLRYRCILERKFIKTLPTIQSIWLQSSSSEWNHQVSNEEITRSGSTSYDYLSNKFVSGVQFLETEFKQSFITTGASSIIYLEGVDFELKVSIPDGSSKIEWIRGGAHPSPGQKYYVSYTYRNMDYKLSIDG